MSGRIISLLLLATRRLLSRPGLTILSLVCVVVAVGLVASIPILAQSLSLAIMRQELVGGALTVVEAPFSVRVTYTPRDEHPLSVADVDDLERYLVQLFTSKLRVPVKRVVTRIESPPLSLRSEPDDLSYGGQGNVHLRMLTVSIMPGLDEHIRVLDGQPFGEADAAERLPVWLHQHTGDAMGLNVGDRFNLIDMRTGVVIPMYIAGMWQARVAGDDYWYGDLDYSLRDTLLVTRPIYLEKLEPLFGSGAGELMSYIVFEEDALSPERAEAYVLGLKEASNVLNQHLPDARLRSPLDAMQRHVQRVPVLLLFLSIFSLPAMGLLLYAFSSVSTVAVAFQREETAILSSRGAGWPLLMLLALAEAGLLALVGTPLGLLLGCELARLMGYTSSFLAFGRETTLRASFWAFDRRMLAAALIILVAARVVPAVRAARESVVSHLRQRSRPVSQSLLFRAAIGIPIILAAAYGYRQLRQRGTFAIMGWEPTGNPSHDPLLMLAPPLFILAVSLILVQLFPLLLRPVDLIAGRLRSFAACFGLRQLARQRSQYASALFLMTVCLGLGAFYASTALSLDTWLYDRVYYQVGADLKLSQGSPGSSGGGSERSGSGGVTDVWMLPSSAYVELLPGVERATRVGYYDASPRLPNIRGRSRFLGIDRLEFPSVAFAKDFPGSPSLGELMNRLGERENGVLVSRNLLEAYGLAEGQQIKVGVWVTTQMRDVDFVIAGTYEHFPTVYPLEENVLVGNLEYFFEQVEDIVPHQVWLRMQPGADRDEILAYAEGLGLAPADADADAQELLEKDRGRRERIGLFGVLSIGFLAGSTLSCVGLLVYTYASLRGRLEQVSVLRAMGARVRDAFAMIAIEYAGLVVYGLVAGVATGIATSRLFVPFFHFSTAPSRALPPFVPQVAWPQIGAITLAFGGALLLAQVAVILGISRGNLPETLRMGQRQ